MRAQGIDIYSNYQPKYDAKVKKHDFIIVKVSDGGWTNPDLRVASKKMDKSQLEQIALVPRKIGYHYMRYNRSIDDQVEAFLEAVRVTDADILRGFAVEGQKWLFDALAVDFEKKYNRPSMRFGRYTKAVMDTVRQETGLRTSLYTRSNLIQGWMYEYGQFWMRDDPDTYPLWLAQYPFYGWDDRILDAWKNRHDLQFSNPRLAAGISTWKFWQPSADGNRKGKENGIKWEPWHKVSPAVDLDVYNGTVEDLDKWLGIESTAPPSDKPPITDLPSRDYVRGYVAAYREMNTFMKSKNP